MALRSKSKISQQFYKGKPGDSLVGFPTLKFLCGLSGFFYIGWVNILSGINELSLNLEIAELKMNFL
jgi:hypothetical protein